MRVIVNIHSGKAAGAAGWRAKAIRVNDKSDATLAEALMAATLKDGSSLYDYIIEDGRLSHDLVMIVNGITLTGESSLRTVVRDNIQIHLMDNPNAGLRV
jgi:hypothetical protein